MSDEDLPIRLPPKEIVRAGPPPPDLLLVVRGGAASVSDAVVERATGDTWEKWRFFGVSVFAAPGGDLVALSARRSQIRRRPQVRVALCGAPPSSSGSVRPSPIRSPIPGTSPTDDLLLWLSMAAAPRIELWVDDHAEYEPGVVHGHLRHARVPIDPEAGDWLVVGDDEDLPVLAEVLSREPDGTLRLRLLPGDPASHPEFATRRQPSLA